MSRASISGRAPQSWTALLGDAEIQTESCWSASCRLLQVSLNRRRCFGQKRVEQTTTDLLAVGKGCVQPVAQRHQRIDLGDDAALFSKGWKGNQNLIQNFEVNILLGGGRCELQEVRLCGPYDLLKASRVL